jgi:hypothetical protein
VKSGFTARRVLEGGALDERAPSAPSRPDREKNAEAANQAKTRINNSANPNISALTPETESGERTPVRFFIRFPCQRHPNSQHVNRRKVTNEPSNRSTLRLRIRFSLC